MANLKTLSDLQTDFLDRVGSSDTTLATRYLNIGLQDMHISQTNRFPWAERRGVLITHAPYSDGTVDVTAAARTTVTGTSTLWNTAVTGMGFNNTRVGGKLKFAGVSEVYEVSVVTNDTSITIASRFTGDALDDADYTYFEDEYALASDFAKFVDMTMFSNDLGIPLVGRTDFRRAFPRNDISGKPNVATYWQRSFSSSTALRHTVVLHPYPDDEYSIPYWYVTNNLAVTSAGVEQERLSASTDEPIIPPQYRHVLVWNALLHYYRDKKDDQRSQEARAEYVDLVTRICSDGPTGDSRPQFIMRGGRTSVNSQRFDYGNRFNEMRDWWRR